MLTLKIWLAVLIFTSLPFLLILWLWKKKIKNKLDWALTLLMVSALSLLAFIATPWGMTSYYLRYLLIILLVPAIFFSYSKVKTASRKFLLSLTERIILSVKVIILMGLLILDVLAIQAYFYRISPVELAFPLMNGAFYVVQGGNSMLTNPFHKSGIDNQEAYALDIVKLNWAGNRATGILPQELNSYTIYGATIHSPCDGEILELVDGIPDNPIGDEGRNPSNHIVIRCKGVRVTLAHMSSGTFSVQNGQFVKEGQPLARVGNAGHTSEPHLHIDAVRDSADDVLSLVEPIPISFNGKVLATNSIVIR